MTVAVCLVVDEWDAIQFAHIIQLMALSGEDRSAHSYGAPIWHLPLPRNAMTSQASFQYAHIQRRGVFKQNAFCQRRFCPCPHFSEHRDLCNCGSADTCQRCIEIIEGLFRVDIAVKLFDTGGFLFIQHTAPKDRRSTGGSYSGQQCSVQRQQQRQHSCLRLQRC